MKKEQIQVKVLINFYLSPFLTVFLIFKFQTRKRKPKGMKNPDGTTKKGGNKNVTENSNTAGN